MKKLTTYILQVTFCALLFSNCQQEANVSVITEHIKTVTDAIDDDALVNADIDGDWLTYGGNYQEDRYSTLDQINKETVKDLSLAWSLDLGVRRGIEASPIVVDGIMYITGPWSVVWAIDLRKGEKIWEYDPEVPRDYGEKACCDVVNRGVALYKGAVFVGTICLLYTSPSPRDATLSRMPSSA